MPTDRPKAVLEGTKPKCPAFLFQASFFFKCQFVVFSTVTPYQSTTPGSCPRPARLSASATTRGASTVGQGSTKGTTWTARRRAPAGAWEATKRRSYEVRREGGRGNGFRCHAWRALHPPHELVHLLTACSPSSASPGSAPALRSSPARGGGRGGDGGLSGTAEREREREREKVCALAHVHRVLEVEVPVGQGDEANGTHAQYLRCSEAHDQVHATTSQPRAPARVAWPRRRLGDLGSSTQWRPSWW